MDPYRDHIRRGSLSLPKYTESNSPSHNRHSYQFSTRRTPCPKCGSSASFSAILGYSDKGKCFRCNTFIRPDEQTTERVQPPVIYDQLFIDLSEVEKTMAYHDHIGLEFYYDRYARQERAAIYEYVAGFTREQAELMAGITVGEHITDGSFEKQLRELFPVFPFAARLMEITRSVCVLSDCLIGLDKDGATIYWYRDISGRIVNGKKIYYDGFHRDKSKGMPHFIRSSSHGYGSCLFGEEQLADDHYRQDMTSYDTGAIVYLVESEKTAVIARYLLPQFIWLATGGATSLTRAKAEVLRGRTVRILFDTDDAGREGAVRAELLLRGMGIACEIFDQTILFQDCPPGYDIADHFDRTIPATQFLPVQ